MSVFVFGSINVDLVFELSRMPQQGETIKGKNFFIAPGGKGANQAVACAKQGLTTYMIGSVGNDSLSQTVRSSLTEAGVIDTYIDTIDNQYTGVAGILLEDGENRIILGEGANGSHSISRIKQILNEQASTSDILLCQLEVPLPILEDVVSFAKTKEMMVVLNAAPAKPLPQSLLKNVDLLIVNEIELDTLRKTGDTIIDKAKSLLEEVPAVLVTVGEDGSLYLDQTKQYQCQAYPVDVIDTTAAGDTFIGAFIAAKENQLSIPDALAYASAASAIAIQKKGAQPSIPTKKDVQKFLIERTS